MRAARGRVRVSGTRSTLPEEAVMTTLDAALFVIFFCSLAVFAMFAVLLIML
jgi:hypothetical protein